MSRIPTTNDIESLSLKEAATLLSVSYWKVHQMAHSGEIPSYKVGSARRIRKAALLEWIKTQEKGGASGGAQDLSHLRQPAMPATAHAGPKYEIKIVRPSRQCLARMAGSVAGGTKASGGRA